MRKLDDEALRAASGGGIMVGGGGMSLEQQLDGGMSGGTGIGRDGVEPLSGIIVGGGGLGRTLTELDASQLRAVSGGGGSLGGGGMALELELALDGHGAGGGVFSRGGETGTL